MSVFKIANQLRDFWYEPTLNRRELPSLLPENACGMFTYDVKSAVGEIDVLRSDEYVNRPGCMPTGINIPMDQRNTAIHEMLHMVFSIPVAEEVKVAAISGVQPSRNHK